MVEIKAVTYEETRSDFLKAEMEKAQNRMKFWQTKIKKAKNAVAEMEAHDNASNAGWECNFYKDALEALDNNKFQYETGFVKGFEAAQPKWISVEERLPETDQCVLYVDDDEVACIVVRGWALSKMIKDTEIHRITHWMPLPSAPKEG